MIHEADPNPALGAWRSTLEELGAVLDGDRIERFEHGARAQEETRVTPLLNRAWLALSGSDAMRFLHDQLTAGIEDMSESEVRLAAYCSPQGRVLALFRMTRLDDGVAAELPAALADAMARRLGMFVLRADVRIEQLEDFSAAGIWGPRAAELLSEAGLPAPGEAWRVERAGALSVTRLPAPEPRFQVTGPAEDVVAGWKAWAEKAIPSPTNDWLSLDVMEALPDIGPHTTDQFLPQSLGLERWQALSYRKGCYPGQEVIARIHYRGRLKRHLYRARVEGRVPAPGTEILGGNGGRVGMVVNAADARGGNGANLLVVLHERGDAAHCHLSNDGTPLTDLERVDA